MDSGEDGTQPMCDVMHWALIPPIPALSAAIPGVPTQCIHLADLSLAPLNCCLYSWRPLEVLISTEARQTISVWGTTDST